MLDIHEIDNVIAILQYGSSLDNTQHVFSDTDICIVAPKTSKKEKIEILRKLATNEKFDIKFFEDLPILLKYEVIKKNKTLFVSNENDLLEYFLFWKKVYESFVPHYKTAKKTIAERLEKWKSMRK